MTGKDRGQTGEVVLSIPKENKVVVTGINKSKRHSKPKKQGGKGQIIEKEMPIHASNVRLAKK